MDLKRFILPLAGVATAVGASVATSAATWAETLNDTIDIVVGILPKIGDLLSGVGTSIIWPVVEILIILGIAGVVLGLFAMVTGIVYAVVHAVTSFASGMGKHRKY